MDSSGAGRVDDRAIALLVVSWVVAFLAGVAVGATIAVVLR